MAIALFHPLLLSNCTGFPFVVFVDTCIFQIRGENDTIMQSKLRLPCRWVIFFNPSLSTKSCVISWSPAERHITGTIKPRCDWSVACWLVDGGLTCLLVWCVTLVCVLFLERHVEVGAQTQASTSCISGGFRLFGG